ncbi:MAG: hypothetical protein DHS20C09_12030 [marine bacterium B5-7]|nr:MAG: hypothetical protein DHS20C09_12030 [marine bacterium B5-7]
MSKIAKQRHLALLLVVFSGVAYSQPDSYLDFTIERDISLETMGSPIAASKTHLLATMGNDTEFAAETVTFPFVHVTDDGLKVIIQAPEVIRSSVGRRAYNTRMISVTELENNGTVAVVRVEFQRYNLQGNATVQGSALWGLKKEDSFWKVSWRQFLGIED